MLGGDGYEPPHKLGSALVELVQADAASVAPAYLLTGAGLETLP